jgi:3-methyl-2-oxobutanoate hydroxymethyltransferase
MTTPAKERVTIETLRSWKGRRRIVALTAHDAPTGRWCARGGVDLILVGDSLGMVAHGLPDTTGVTLEMMELAVASAGRGMTGAERRPLLVADLPLVALADPVAGARRLLSAGAEAIKIECHEEGEAAMVALREAGIEVMAHVGLLPQEIERLGGYRLQGTDDAAAARIIATARRAEAAGAFSCVVEKVPAALGGAITAALEIPTIGIGAGPECDGQILVLYDVLGIFEDFRPRFARRYLEIGRDGIEAVRRFGEDVRNSEFPLPKESFT